MRPTLSRTIWGVAGQGISSASSLALAIMVSRESPPAEVGPWAIGYGLYTFALVVSRNVVSTPSLVSAAPNGPSSIKPRGPLSASLLIGIVLAIPLIAAGALAGGVVRDYLSVFALGLPILICQDALRYWFIRAGRPSTMALMDAFWLCSQLALGVAAIALGFGGLGVTVAWVAGAAISMSFGFVCSPACLSFEAAREFIAQNRRASATFLTDAVLGSGAASLLPAILGMLLGLTATGYFRGGQTLLGFAGIVVTGITPIATVELARRRNSRRVEPLFITVWVAAMIGIGLAFWLALEMTPNSVGAAILGESWKGAITIMVPLSLQLMVRGPFVAIPIILRVRGAYANLIAARAVSGVSILSVTVLGAHLAGLQGAAWGWFLGSAASSLVYILAYFILQRRARSLPLSPN